MRRNEMMKEYWSGVPDQEKRRRLAAAHRATRVAAARRKVIAALELLSEVGIEMDLPSYEEITEAVEKYVDEKKIG